MLAERGEELPAAHPVELLDRAIRAAEARDERTGAPTDPRRS